MASFKNIGKAYDLACSGQPRNAEFKKAINIGIWEAKVALTRLFNEKPWDSLSDNEKAMQQALALDGMEIVKFGQDINKNV
jgi:hypothetical protein